MRSQRARRWARDALVLFALLWAGPSPAQDAIAERDLGAQAYRRGNHAYAAKLWRPLAEQGDAYAQFGLGLLYYEGHGVERDLAVSTRWFRRAAEQGYGPAQFNLGNAYKHGNGVPIDDTAAADWWRLAAEQDYAAAQYNLALQYYFGRGVERSESTAFVWLRRAADNGHAEAIALLASARQDVPAAADADRATAPPAAAASSRRAARVDDASSGAAHPGGIGDEEWILGQDPDAFTLQILASGQEQGIGAVLAREPLPAPSATFRFTRGGQDWFALIQGVHETRAAAKAAIGTLPAAHRGGPPWIRRFAEIQALIGERR